VAGSDVARSLRVSPNPVAERAAISYNLPRSASVSCVVYDAAGNVVSRLAAGSQAAGEHSLTWNAAGVKPGIYFCKLVADGNTGTARMVRVR
jgi:hypothetical protein